MAPIAWRPLHGALLQGGVKFPLCRVGFFKRAAVEPGQGDFKLFSLTYRNMNIYHLNLLKHLILAAM